MVFRGLVWVFLFLRCASFFSFVKSFGLSLSCDKWESFQKAASVRLHTECMCREDGKDSVSQVSILITMALLLPLGLEATGTVPVVSAVKTLTP